MAVSDINMYLGLPGRLEQIVVPKGNVDHARIRQVDVYALGNGGYRVGKLLGGTRRYTISYQRLQYDDFKKIEAYEQGHKGPGPFVLLDPGLRNVLSVNQSSTTSERNNTDGFTLAASGSSLSSNPYHYRRGPRSLAWTLAQASAGLVLLGGNGDYASAPDAAALDIVGDIDLRADVTLPSWNTGADQSLIGKYTTTGNQRSFRFYVRSTGKIALSWSTDGTSGGLSTEESTAAPSPAASGRLAVRVTLDVDNGAAGHTLTFYTAPNMDGTWTQLGSAVTTAGVTSIFSSTAVLEVGTTTLGTGFRTTGTIHSAQALSGIGGTTVANPIFTNQAPVTSSFVDSSGNTWTINGAATIGSQGHAVSLNAPAPEWYGYPVHVGRSMVLSAYIKGGGTDGAISISATMRWLTEGGSSISSNTGSVVVTTSGSWQQVLVAATPPASAAFVTPVFTAASGGATGDIVYYDEMMLHEGTTVDSTWSPGGGILPVVPLGLADAWPFQAGQYRERPVFVLQEVGGGG